MDDDRVIDLGGVSSSPCPRTVGLLARGYAHPHLPGRTIVRLVREPLREVEDLSLGVLGFQPTDGTRVGHVRNRAVGFPAWPVIHDPANARHALNLVADLNRAAAIAGSRPKQAKDLLDSLAVTLGGSAPHFLPTFLEEAARIFIACDNLTYATQFFAKARQAERVHNLAIDEDRHREVLLEFALAGALSAKELTNEATSLLRRTTPAEALGLFVDLNVAALRGGLPPYSALASDLKRLAKASGTDLLATKRRVLSAVLASPAARLASLGFWDGFRDALADLAAADTTVGETLLAIVPGRVTTDDWVGVLETAGVPERLRQGSLPAAAWVQRYLRALQERWQYGYPRKLAQLIATIPGLRGAQIRLHRVLDDLEPELLDALLAAGASVTFSHAPFPQSLSLYNWTVQEERPNLDALAASEHASLCMRGIGSLTREELGVWLAHSGTRAMLLRWARPRFGDNPTLEQASAELERLRPLWTHDRVALLGAEFYSGLPRLDAAELLASALRDGLLTELTWPALERTAGQLTNPGAGQDRHPLPQLHPAWPAIGVSHSGIVRWVDGDWEGPDVTLACPDAVHPEDWAYTLIDGVTGCVFFRPDGRAFLAWSDAPTTWHHQGAWRPDPRLALSLPVPDGRLTVRGLQRVGAPEAIFSSDCGLVHDGTGYWRTTMAGLEELDPATGQAIRESLPSALADLIEPYLRDGFTLDTDTLMWHPNVATTTGSLLSTQGGWHTWVGLENHAESLVLDADGSVFRFPKDEIPRMIGRLSRPGGGHWLCSWYGLLARDRSGAVLAAATDRWGRRHVLHEVPRCGWHQFRVRDAAASARLRSMTAEQVRALLAATPTAPQYQPYPTDQGFDLVSAEARCAASALLGTDDPALVDAVVWLAARTKRLIEDAERWTPEERAPIADSGTFADWEPSCAVANGILMASYDGHARLPRSAITALGALARGEDAEAKGLTVSTFLPIARPEVMLALASAPLRPAAAVRGAAALVGAVLDAGLYTRESLIRSFTYEFTTEQCLLGPGAVFPTPRGPSISLGVTHNLGRDISGLCWSPGGGRPRVLGRDTEPFLNPSSVPPDRIVAAFQRLIADGPPPWDPAKATRLAEGIGWSPAEATLLLAGLPYFPVREKNFLPKPLRELLGLSVAEAATARSSLRDRSPVLLIQMLSAGAQDPLRVVTEGIDVDAIVGAWQRRFGKRHLLLPSALVTEADSVFPEFGASRVRRLSRGHVSGYSSVTALLWLASRLDGTDPLRAQVADWFEAVRDGLPRCVFSWSEWPRRPIVRPLLGLPPAPRDTSDGPHQCGAWTIEGSNGYDRVSWSPSEVADWDAERVFVAGLPACDIAVRQSVDLVTGAFDAIIADLRRPGRGPCQDPLNTAPGIVAAAAAAVGLPPDSARYWLQLLALPNPTDHNVNAWNGWSTPERLSAAAPLLDRGLVVEATRNRSGRTLFLPGGWLEADPPHLPMEEWKAVFFDLEDAPKVTPRREIVVPLVPFGQLFQEAWDRYRCGEAPGYTELRTKRRRER